MNYSVDVESLHRHFPVDWQVPSLLRDFGSWLKRHRAGSVGNFCLQSERFSDFWTENGADLHPYFASSFKTPRGAKLDTGFTMDQRRSLRQLLCLDQKANSVFSAIVWKAFWNVWRKATHNLPILIHALLLAMNRRS